MNSILALGAVNGGLRVDGQEAELVQLRELGRDDRRLGCRGGIRPWQSGELAQTERAEQRADLFDRRRTAPEGETLVFLQTSHEHEGRESQIVTGSTYGLLDPETISIQFTIRRTAGVSETTIRVFVPVLGT